ncbi:NUDIX hydrolase [Staphylococcus chromogenes]|nr:NUDIX hydrolase [Staphylococcus chromogenes]
MQGDGDGWAAGPNGTRLWGHYGAAGLFLQASTAHGPAVLLQLRAHWTADGGTWGIPGGARDSHETPSEAALRETVEEAGIDPTRVRIHQEVITSGPFPADPQRPELSGGWTYTTVLASTDAELATTANDESIELRWVPIDQLESLELIPPLRAALPALLEAWSKVAM